jgi:fructose-1,6-bisphosphatase/sedoheptulose 1,7-bisphosphatase-like protein
MRGRLVVAKEGQAERLKKMGVTDLKRVYTEKELAPADDLLFVATASPTARSCAASASSATASARARC